MKIAKLATLPIYGCSVKFFGTKTLLHFRQMHQIVFLSKKPRVGIFSEEKTQLQKSEDYNCQMVLNRESQSKTPMNHKNWNILGVHAFTRP